MYLPFCLAVPIASGRKASPPDVYFINRFLYVYLGCPIPSPQNSKYTFIKEQAFNGNSIHNIQRRRQEVSDEIKDKHDGTGEQRKRGAVLAGCGRTGRAAASERAGSGRNLQQVQKVGDESSGKPGRPADAQETRGEGRGEERRDGKKKGIYKHSSRDFCFRLKGFPGGSVVNNPPAMQERRGVSPWVRKIP